MKLLDQVRVFKWISILEGLSFLILLFLAMPLKYFLGMPEMVKITGMAHGLLFILYLMAAAYMYRPLNWSPRILFVVIACSVLPFGPFYVEKKYLSTPA